MCSITHQMVNMYKILVCFIHFKMEHKHDTSTESVHFAEH
jgi:hypothetical protein